VSYDFQVFARAGLTPAAVGELAREQGFAWELSGETWEASRPESNVQFGGDVPVPMEQEDLPKGLAELLREPRWFMVVVVEGSGAASIRAATRFVRELARRTGAAVYDQQLGRVLVDGKVKRPARVESEPEWKVEMSWYAVVPEHDARPSLPDEWLALAGRYLPEAAPVRFGHFEPLRFRLARDGMESFRALWSKEDPDDLELRYVDFDSVPPILGGGWSWSLPWHAPRPVIERISADVEIDAFADPYWANAAQEWFVAVAEARKCFHAVVQVARPGFHPRTLIPRHRWYGLLPRPQWWTWYGNPYVALVEERSPKGAYRRTGDGVFVGSQLSPRGFAEMGQVPDPLGDLRAALVEPEVPLSHNPNLVPAAVIPHELLPVASP